MPKRKHVNKQRPVPRTDANQGVIEHTERIRKQNAYIIRKIAEMKARQQEMMEQQRLAQQSTASQTIDAMDGSRDIANE